MFKWIIIGLVLVVAGCEKRWDGAEKEYRYADFNTKIIASYVQNPNNQTRIEKIAVKVIPTRVGAYLIGDTKISSTALESKEYEFSFWGNEFLVYYSDGKSIEVTKVKAE